MRAAAARRRSLNPAREMTALRSSPTGQAADRDEHPGPALPPVPFEVRVCPYREAVHLKVVGELDLGTVDTLRSEHERMLARAFAHVVIDLRELEFIDAAGLRLLLALTAEARRDGWCLSLIQGPHAVRRVFDLTGTLHALPFTLPLSTAAV